MIKSDASLICAAQKLRNICKFMIYLIISFWLKKQQTIGSRLFCGFGTLSTDLSTELSTGSGDNYLV